MLTFILCVLLLLLLTVSVLIWPLLKSRDSVSYERHTQNIYFARERLSELEQQLHNAAISAEDYEALKLEIETTLAQDIDLSEGGESKIKEPHSTSNAVVIALVSCWVPVAAVTTYLLTGTPNVLNHSAAAVPHQAQNVDAQGTEIDELISSLKQRLVNQPNDTQGWTILARTYQQLGRYAESIEAYQTLLGLQPNNADTYAGLADASALAAGGSLAGKPASYVEKALQLDPNHAQSLWLAGLIKMQSGNSTDALTIWRRLLPMLAQFPQQQAELQSVIEQTEAAAGTAPVKVAEAAKTNETKAQLHVAVSIAPQRRDEVNADDVIFVIARAQQGPPAPLAVKRLTVGDLPASVTLSAADAMMPQLSLDKFDQVAVTARLSRSGNPITQAGDVQSAVINTLNSNSETINLVISEPIE